MGFFIKTFFTVVVRKETILTRFIPNNTSKYCFCSFQVLQKQEESTTRIRPRLKEPPIPPDLPMKPKKPITSFIRFVMSMKSTILRDNPTLTERELRKYAAELWGKTSTEAKVLYQMEYYTELEKYYDNMSKYKSSLTEKQIIATRSLQMRKKEERIRNKIKKTCEEFAKPKRPLNSFALYMASRKDEFKNIKADGYWHQLIEDWHELPENKKNVFRQKSKTLRRKYYEKLAEWKAQAQPLNVTHVTKIKEDVNSDSEFSTKP